LPRGFNRLCRPATANILFESVSFRQNRGDWYVHLLLLMPDHLHGLIYFPANRGMKSVISNWKEILAKKSGVSWQRDFFDHRVRADESFAEKTDYIRMNPVRKKLVAEAALWPFVWQPN
jgi:putative transposase